MCHELSLAPSDPWRDDDDDDDDDLAASEACGSSQVRDQTRATAMTQATTVTRPDP